MKTRSVQSFGLGLALSVLPFVGGCNQQPGSTLKNSTNAALAPVDSLSPNNATTDLPSTTEPTSIPTPPAERTLPANIKPSPPLAEVIKLVNAGVEEDVLIAYANSSQSAFNLGSDEIIYLSDLGIPDAVVTAMIERDRTLKQPWSPSVQPAPAEAPTTPAPEEQEQPVAAAPTYVDPPEPYPVEQPQQVVNDNYFYDNLSPYGSWTQVDGYGWCWQPTVVALNRSWQPYCDRGRWLYTDCGWYWQSDYSWGLTFHYGRWFNHPNRGWCWAPDRVWGPAWVTWRYNDNYCGWAPLPPRTYCRPGVGLAYYNSSVGVSFNFGLSANCFTFVTWRGFCDSRPSRHRLSSAQTTTVINNTTVVNNIVSGNNNTIINRGIAPDRVAQHAGRSVQRTTVRDAQIHHGRSLLAENQSRASQTFDDRRAHWPGARSMPSSPTRSENNGTANVAVSSPSAPTLAQPSQPVASSPTPSTSQPNTGSHNFRDNGTSRHVLSESHDRGTRSLIVHGSGATDQSVQAAPPQNAPAGSLVVIGKREDTQRAHYSPSTSRSTFAYNQIQTPETVQQPAPQATTPTPGVPRNWSTPAAMQMQRQDNSHFNHRVESRVENRSSSPVVNRSSAPAYAPPMSPQPAPQQLSPAPVSQPAPATVAPREGRVESQATHGQVRQSESSSRSSNSGSSDHGSSGRSDRGDRQH